MSTLLFEPGKFFPSCHASNILPLTPDTTLVAYFAGTHEKHPDVGIWLSESSHGIWHSPRLISKLSNEPHWNPVLLQTPDGIRLIFKVGSEISSWRSATLLSRDLGANWSSPQYYPSNPAGGPVRSHPIRLQSGALLAPNSDESGSWRPRVDISYDEGSSFHRLADIPINLTDPSRPDFISGRGAIQPTLWESAPGIIHALLRTSAGYIFRSDSADNGCTWSLARSTGIPNNNSGIDIAQAPDGRLFLALNPVSGDFAARTPLCIYLSENNGDTFSPFAVLEDAPLDDLTGKSAEFSYPSLAIHEGRLLASYTFNRRSIAFWSCNI